MDKFRELHIRRTNKTPEIFFDPKTGFLEITGISISKEFYQTYETLLTMVNKYVSNVPGQETVVIFKLIYFSDASTLYLIDILYKLQELSRKKHSIKVIWYYEKEDSDMREQGLEFEKQLTQISFSFIQVPEHKL